MSLQLTPADRGSGLWVKLEQHLHERLVALQGQLEGDKEPDETNRLRGRIREIKGLLKEGEPAPRIDPEPVSRI